MNLWHSSGLKCDPVAGNKRGAGCPDPGLRLNINAAALYSSRKRISLPGSHCPEETGGMFQGRSGRSRAKTSDGEKSIKSAIKTC